jgi:hypothetical protein
MSSSALPCPHATRISAERRPSRRRASRTAVMQQWASRLSEAACPAPIGTAWDRALERLSPEALHSDHVASAVVDPAVPGSQACHPSC